MNGVFKPSGVRSPEVIKAEIEALMALRDRIPPYSAFGDPNVAQLDAQVMVLRNRMSSNEIWERWAGDGQRDGHIRWGADQARNWLDGEDDQKPSDDWETML